MNQPQPPDAIKDSDIAIIGLAGRFPGAEDIEAFWLNLRNGVESISFFSNEELIASGIDAAALDDPRYIKASAVLTDIEQFDAPFFSFSPREAEIMDPQHRLFLECAWESLENAGYDPDTYEGSIGLYAGVGMNTYLLNNLYPGRYRFLALDSFQWAIGNDKDFLPTMVSYKLNLRGPSVNVQTACSTSLVATHLACQSLLNGECDIALAGGVSVNVPHKAGHLFQEGSILSPDGHCRAFDAQAHGTVNGNGVGIVVLKRLADALADGDTIQAVIKGTAINNDGSLKVGYTAPGVEGQAAVILETMTVAGIPAETIAYVEAHGTGTVLGDPVEIAALTQAFRAHTQKKGFCAIGSVKTNIGHLGAAAGVAGLIKTVLALKHKLLPPSLHFERPNPKIDFDNSPFYINTALSEWKTNGSPHRAGVSSFGIGGTNAHLILEEAPPLAPSGESRPWQLLTFSARTPSALEAATARLAAHLKRHPDIELADVAYTLNRGRKAFNYRRTLICQTLDEAVSTLETPDTPKMLTRLQETKNVPVVFMFSGQGTQYVNMAEELYRAEPVFREQVDRCASLFDPLLGIDLRDVLYPGESTPEAERQLERTAIAQPALFTIEYALAQLWVAWGVRPQAMIGHSLGEYVAACLADVISLEDAVALVAARGKLMQQPAEGAMLAVPLAEQSIRPLLDKGLSLAAVNGPALCVVSGFIGAIEALHARLAEQGVDCRRLHTSHAFHSDMMDPILGAFAERVRKVVLNPPRIPYVSNVTGNWITPAEATDPIYWANHLRQTVRFADGLTRVLAPDRILLEIGPGQTLSTFAKQHQDAIPEQVTLSSLRRVQDAQSDVAFLLTTVGQLWLAGASVAWSGFYAHEQRRRIPLPTYPFERRRYWIDPPAQSEPARQVRPESDDQPDSEALNRERFLAHQRPNLQTAYVAPRNEMEHTLAAVWQELLGVEQVGIHDDFYALGGHSLIATQLISRLQQIVPLELPVRDLFESRTVAGMAQIIERTIFDKVDELSEEEAQRLLSV